MNFVEVWIVAVWVGLCWRNLFDPPVARGMAEIARAKGHMVNSTGGTCGQEMARIVWLALENLG